MFAVGDSCQGLILSSIIVGNKSVWIVGSSIIKHAFTVARGRPGGASLGLRDTLNTRVLWHGKSGLVIQKIRREVDIMSRYEDPPDIIVIHIGGNDIGDVRLGYLQYLIKRFFIWLRDQFPWTLIVWSQILPRMTWRYSANNKAMNKVRRRVNSTVAKNVIEAGGRYIHYPEVHANPCFLLDDGVHLNPFANEYFVTMIRGALESFLTKPWIKSYPR